MFWYRTKEWPKPSTDQIFYFQLLYVLIYRFPPDFPVGSGERGKVVTGQSKVTAKTICSQDSDGSGPS